MIKRKSRLIDMKHFLKELLKKYGHIWILGYGFTYLPWFMASGKNRDFQLPYHALIAG